ncbi:MAG: T9SS type A sorting domain-containing protein, partial [Chitinophagales bacterium]
CSKTSTAVAIVKTLPVATITASGSLDLCVNPSLTLTANFGTGYTYQWKKGSQTVGTNQSYLVGNSFLSAGNYKVTVTTPGGCSTTSAVKTVSKSCKEGSVANVERDVAMNLYPNPTNGNFIVEMNLPGEISEENATVNIQLLNLLGQQMKMIQASVVDGKAEQEIHLDNSIPSGVYYVKMLVGDHVYLGQLVYQR